jgi:hypothetical protein
MVLIIIVIIVLIILSLTGNDDGKLNVPKDALK